MNSVALPRQSIVSPTRVVVLLVGISFLKTPPTPLLPTSLPFRDILRRVTIQSFIVELLPPTSPRKGRRRSTKSPTPIGYDTSSRSLPSVPVSAISYVKTSVKRICRSGSRSRTSRRSSVSLRVPWPPARPVETLRLPGRRRWNVTTNR